MPSRESLRTAGQRARRAVRARVDAVDLDRLRARTVAGLADAGRRLDPRGWPRWVLGVLLLAVPSQALGVWRVLGDLPAGMRPPMLDSIIFEYVGWYLSVGGRLYVDVWEIKPPLPFELTALLAVLARGDPWTLHALGIGVSVAAAVGTALVAGALVDDLTGDGAAAFAAGAALYVYPAWYWRAGYGFKVKYLVALLALAAVYLARRDRPASAGVLAGAAAASWQLAVAVPVLVAGVAADRLGRDAAGRSLLAALAVVVASVLPVVYWGAVEAMITETVLVPLLVSEDLSTVAQLQLGRQMLGGALPVFLVGLVGVGVAARRRPRATWWLAGATAWFALLAAFVDHDGPPDLFPLVAFVAVGVGLLLGEAGGDQRPAALLVAVLAVTAVVTAGGFGLTGSPLHQPAPVVFEPDRDLQPGYTPVEQAHLFWLPARPETCRVFFGPTQYRLVQRTGGERNPETCGDAGPVLDALREAWGV